MYAFSQPPAFWPYSPKARLRVAAGDKDDAQRFGRGDASAFSESANTTDGSFDRWLNAKLRFLYAPVLDEPIPDELLALIQAKKDATGDK